MAKDLNPMDYGRRPGETGPREQIDNRQAERLRQSNNGTLPSSTWPTPAQSGRK